MLADMYHEYPAAPPGAVLWTRTVPAGGGTVPVLPDGCVDLIWVDGELLVAGPDTVAHPAEAAAGTRYVGLRFAPGTGPAVLGVPGYELRDARVPLAAPRLAAVDPLAATVVDRLRRGDTVAATAAAVGLGERALHRRCRSAFGYGPKVLARILRLQRALAQARRGVPFATVAAGCGYADQAHLAREVRALTGTNLSRLAG